MKYAWDFQEKLTPTQIFWRGAFLVSTIGALAFLRAVDPSGGWIGGVLSCGAVTGLPCLFCGLTRGLHHLLNGDLSRALYFNWIAFPILFASLGVCVVVFLEIVAGRHVAHPSTQLRITPRGILFSSLALIFLWSGQVFLAISQHKRELLNPAGPLYSLFVN
ncbi:MAG: DUF2752 domain-containing protein [Chthoniobacterales bacterium]